MAKILPLGVAIVLMLATAALSFMLKGKVTGLKGELTSAQMTLQKTQLDLSKTKDALTTSTQEVAAAKATIVEKDKDIAGEKEKRQTAENQMAQLQPQITTLTAENGTLKAEIETLKKPGTLKPEEAAELQTKLKEKETLLATLTDDKKKLETEKKSAQDKVQQLETDAANKLTAKMKIGLEGVVMAVNPSWNFVVINIGDKQGVAMNAEMIVKRDGQRVGKVKITSVEPSTAVADIVPGSLSKGMRVQAGDRVIFEGS
jgi:predicted RNase H-like nuclease (RuvC/YqgF family)